MRQKAQKPICINLTHRLHNASGGRKEFIGIYGKRITNQVNVADKCEQLHLVNDRMSKMLHTEETNSIALFLKSRK